jgi:UDP-N-acetylmuramate dehydrogenase
MLEKNCSLQPYNTFGIDVQATAFDRFSSVTSLETCLKNNTTRLELLIVGGGSNILLTKNFDGLVLKNEIKGFEVISENNQAVIVQVGAGEIWHAFVLKCIELGFAGVENMSLIPGSVGASPMQNIGAYGVEIKDVFHSLEAYHIETGAIHTFDKEQCEFGYRESVFKRKLKGQYVIVSVSFQLSKTATIHKNYGAIETQLTEMGISTPSIKDISDAVIAIRRSKLPDPAVLGNAGSFFKNPVVDQEIVAIILQKFPDAPNYPADTGKRKLAAGWLIEQTGWKGKTIGTCGVHKLQALVLVNYGGSTGQQIYDLSTQIIASVYEKFGVTLEREVNIL